MWTAIRDPLFDESEVLERGAGQRLRFFHARGFLACAANNPPLGCTVDLVSSTRSPWMASISAGVSSALASAGPFVTPVAFLTFCGAASPSTLAKTSPMQGKIVSV